MTSYIIDFDYRSEDGPSQVGPFDDRADAEAYLDTLSGPGWSSECSIHELTPPMPDPLATPEHPDPVVLADGSTVYPGDDRFGVRVRNVYGGSHEQIVHAHSLKDALHKAADLPFPSWFPELNRAESDMPCGYDVGDPPDSCRCLLTRGHSGLHECKHKQSEAAPVRTIAHLPVPGPLYWDWKCRICSEPVDQHLHWWQLLWRRLNRANGAPQ